ncbi:MAG TPA: hypothetical protein VGN52_18465 [Burkholderiales bacterium]|jgi:hypothetical protein
MTCALCGGQDHPAGNGRNPILNCPTFVRVPQTLKDSITDLWTRNPQNVEAGEPLADWIYDHIYSPGSLQQGSDEWTFHYGSTSVHLTEERIYMSVKSTSLLQVWNVLLNHVFRVGMGKTDITQAKHCLPRLADLRPDSIVIYVWNRAGVWRTCDTLRDLRHRGLISDSDFNQKARTEYSDPQIQLRMDRIGTLAPGTGAVPDLPGVSTAPQPPDPKQSHGSRLSRILGSVFDARNRPVRLPTAIDFMVPCLVAMKDGDINITAPWKRQDQL